MFPIPQSPSSVMSLDSAIQYLTSTMEKPSSAHSACHWRMGAAATRLEEASKVCKTLNDHHRLAKPHSKFLRAAIRFLTRKQTTAEHAAMVKDLCNCRCDLQRPGMVAQHYLGGRGADVFHDNERLVQVIYVISTWVCAALRGSTKSKFKGGQSTDSTVDPPWPGSPDDLLPYGPADSVEGLQLWVMEPGGDVLYLVPTALVVYYQPFAEATFRPPDYTFNIERPLQYLEESMALCSKDPTNAARHLERTRIIHSFLGAHLAHNYSGRFVSTMVAKKARAYHVLNKLWGMVAGRSSQDEIRAGTAVLRDLCKFEFHPVTGEPYLPPGQTMDSADVIPGPLNEVEDALSHMYYVRSGGCLNPTCTSNREGVTTRLCSKCNVVRYCGEQCQKAAWKHPKYPHKVLCMKIHTLKQLLGLKDWKPVLERAELSNDGSGPFLELCKAKGVDLASVEEIADILQRLRDPILGNMGSGI